MQLSRFYTKAKLDLILCALSVVCVWLMLRASDDPVISLISHSPLSSVFFQFPAGNQIIFDLSVGGLSAILMFYLLVRLPEHEKKSRVKRHLMYSYESFKESTIHVFVGAVDGSINSDLVKKLMDQKEFGAYFKKPFVPGQDRWDGVANKMDDFMLRQLVLETEVLHNEFQHAIGAIDIRDPEVFTFMKRLSEILFRAKNWSSDYDGTKEVLRFFWDVLAGWSFVTGQRDSDYIADMISEL